MAAPVPMLGHARNLTASASPEARAALPAYGTRAGAQPVDRVVAYLYCEYSYVSTTPPTPADGTEDAETGSRTTIVRCSAPAILMPGYKRACSQHVVHVLVDSLSSYLTRPTPALETLPTNMQAQRELDMLNVQHTLTALDAVLHPPAPKAAKRTSTPRAKKVVE